MQQSDKILNTQEKCNNVQIEWYIFKIHCGQKQESVLTKAVNGR